MPTTFSSTTPAFDVDRIRADFPILHLQVNGHPIVYLDNAATSQKPNAVIDAVAGYYREYNSNIHRGVHSLSVRATDAYEAVRSTVRRFINAERDEEIIFTKGDTEATNLLAYSWGRDNIGPGDEIILSNMEHHSNIVPWQMLCDAVGAHIRVIPVTDNGDLDLEAYEQLFSDRTKLVGCVHVSNSLGTINPVKEIVATAHRHGAITIIDGAQAAPHMAIDVRDIGSDFYVITGHKMFGPTGIGALYGRFDLLDSIPPFHGGGDMILSVSFDGTTYNKLPNRLEAGTPNIAGTIGFGAAIDYLNAIGMETIAAWEHELLNHGTAVLSQIPGLKIHGRAKNKAAVISFTIDGMHPHDIGTILDQYGIAIRTGHHCTQPLMERFGIPATARASMSFYNTKEELDVLATGIRRAIEVLT